MTTTPYATNMCDETTAFLNHVKLVEQVVLEAASYTAVSLQGLVIYTIPTQFYDKMPENQVETAEGVVIRPRQQIIRPVRPEDPTAVQMSVFMYELSQYTKTVEGLKVLSDNIKCSISPSALEALNTAAINDLSLCTSPYKILDFLALRYSRITDQHVLAIKAHAAEPYTDRTTVQAHLDAMLRWFAQLDSIQQPLSQGDQISIARKTFEGHPRAIMAYSLYVQTYDLNQRTFASMMKFIISKEPNMEPSVADLGYSQVNSVTQNTPDIGALAAAVHAFTLTAGRGGRGNAGRGSSNAGRGQNSAGRGNAGRAARGRGRGSPPARNYCYVHGYDGHPGISCNAMAMDSTYTTQYKTAMSHLTAPDVDGSQYRV